MDQFGRAVKHLCCLEDFHNVVKFALLIDKNNKKLVYLFPSCFCSVKNGTKMATVWGMGRGLDCFILYFCMVYTINSNK